MQTDRLILFRESLSHPEDISQQKLSKEAVPFNLLIHKNVSPRE